MSDAVRLLESLLMKIFRSKEIVGNLPNAASILISENATHLRQGLGARREQPCRKIVEKMVELANQSGIMENPSVENFELIVLFARSLVSAYRRFIISLN